MRYKYIVSGFRALDQYLYALEDSVTYTKLKWKTKVGENSVYASLSLGLDGNIYVGCLDFSFNAYRVEDGERKWRYVTQWCVFSSAALMGDGTIYIGSKDHNLYALEDSLAYYKKKWSYATGQFYDGHLIDSSPAIGSDGTIYFGTDPYGAAGQTPVIADTNFWAVNPDGTLKWTFETGDGVESSPAIGYDGTIYFGSYDGCLYAVSDKGNQGVLKWKFCTNGPIDCSPAVDGDGIIYFGSRDSTLYALYPDGK